MERLINAERLKDDVEYGTLCNVSESSINTKEEKLNTWIQEVIDKQPTVEAVSKDYYRAFKIACDLLSGSVLYGIDSDKIFELMMDKDGVVSNNSYEEYILNHLQELDHGQYAVEPTTKNDLAVVPCEDAISRQAVIEPKPMVEIDLDYVIKQKYIEREVLDKIRDQIKSNLRGVEITLEVLVENDPLRPKMEGAKDTLEDCLELIDNAESEK